MIFEFQVGLPFGSLLRRNQLEEDADPKFLRELQALPVSVAPFSVLP